MNENNIISYAFMTALLQGGSNLYSYVYLPLVKRAINIEASLGKKKLSCDDLRYSMMQLYGLQIPQKVSEKLLKLFCKDASRKQKESFCIEYDNSSNELRFTDYQYKENESIYDRERRNVNLLQEEFEKYMASEEPENFEYPSFSKFIDQNKQVLSGFFSGKFNSLQEQTDESYLPHVQFLNSIEHTRNDLYTTARNVYLGTLMATFLEDEVDLDAKIKDKTKYFFDTQLILEALDLQDKSKTKPIKDLIEIICRSGGYVKILDVTLNELSNILRNSISRFDTDGTDYVVDACKSRGRNLQWLTKLASNLEERLRNELQIDVVSVSSSDREKFLATDEYKKLSARWFKGNRAKHDAIAYLYVRSLRNTDSVTLQKAGYWFVTANEELYAFNEENRNGIGITEITTPSLLTSMLFMTNPSKLANKVSHIMLSESIAQVIQAETPSIDMIREFEEVVSKLDIIAPNEYLYLREALALKSSKSLSKLLKDQKSLPDVTKGLVKKTREKELERAKESSKREKLTIILKITISIIIFLIGVILFVLVYFLNPNQDSCLIVIGALTISSILLLWIWKTLCKATKYIFSFILGAGGLWGFVNAAINVCKLDINELIKSLGKFFSSIN